MNVFNNLNKLIENINFDYFNFNIINKNVKQLLKFHSELQNIWNNIKIIEIKEELLDRKNNLIIKKILTRSIFKDYKFIVNITKKNFKIYKFYCDNIEFYYLDILNKFNDDINKIKFMMKITLTLKKFNNYLNLNHNIIIIWLPVDKNRDYNHNIINNELLKECEDNFNAFTCSGVTFGGNPRFTIITRYEEVEKLLIHELIHNFRLDGSNFHHQMNDLIDELKIIKLNNYDYEFSIYESYTELLCTYLSILFFNIEINNTKILKNKIKSLIILEIVYSYNIISNLLNLNNSLDSDVYFFGNICFYEYYYIKGLMYNNFIIELGNNSSSFYNIYKKILEMLKKINKNEKLLIYIKNNFFKTNNFKYTISC